MKTRICTSTLLCLLLQLPLSAVATPVFEGRVQRFVGGEFIRITEYGPKDSPTWLWPTHEGGLITGDMGVPVRLDGTLDQPHPASTDFSHTFEVGATYLDPNGNEVEVTDYAQQTGDPAILQASAFKSGVMVDSLWGWLRHNGYVANNYIFQPDFFLMGGGDVYFAVDLAALGAAGKAFVDTWALGSLFSINASGGLDDMPLYMFSSTPFDYTAGSGWTGGTPLAVGTALSFDAFHQTSAVPEPGTLLLVGIAFAGAWLNQRKRRVQL